MSDLVLDPVALRAEFPLLSTLGRSGRRLIYLDSAASSQRPTVVLDTMREYYETTHANVHRGVYQQRFIEMTDHRQLVGDESVRIVHVGDERGDALVDSRLH